MQMMPVTDSMFLLMESREHPMHVGGLQLFKKPEGAGEDYVHTIYRNLIDSAEVRPLFKKRPAAPVNSLGQWMWSTDNQLDLDYHVRRSALPNPGRIRELLELTSRWHGSLLDRHRPLWETHFVEGLSDGRFAIYTKVHHAVLDGISALRHMTNTLSEDPTARDCPAPWELRAARPKSAGLNPLSFARSAGRALGEFAAFPPTALRAANQAFREQRLTLPLQAPKTMLNVPIGGARRFAAQSWPLESFRKIKKSAGTTLNDVVLAMCAGALRDYLIEQRALPDAPLTAMVPATLRTPAAAEEGGNSIGAILCNLATNEPDPARRLETIKNSMADGKKLFEGLSPVQVMLLSAMNVAPLGLSPVPGMVNYTRPPFNLVISNVPGPRTTTYWNGAELDGVYPASLLMDGQALNITLTTRVDSVDFGIVGCRQSIPHLQRMLLHLDTALTELEFATR
ncbi:wax ester/triacylglycerol synthase family O-acyltransferase [Haloechinothrix sp. YIM 98757]|uniref:Diacylglycerol O-acyltransferase n=1 Tax=Haloechinothrix aidingensis TaxID=2752311 RepID=A0A838A9D9_9PSEU|nr:wax ester/triacylglycerol synthase family O-acyltransferase [Haloechinothrix aidingensis]MBA0125259.1 wax ester/triacylglycerol synthase family O-acyltransferase [Haloechinothrix aidingensis]